MAVLVGGQTWGLSASKNGNKSVVLVKLTDSSLRALENYIQNESLFPVTPASSLSKPTIRFPSGHLDTGTISIPLGPDGKKAEFLFSLSSNDDAQGPKGSFECLSVDKQGSLESIGTLQEKLHVQASDDTYTRFGQKMHEAKKESEKRTTQFLDRRPSSSSRITFVRKNPISNAHPKDSAISAKSARSSNYLSGTHPMLDRSSKSTYSKMNHLNTDLMRRPLRERIIHLLAVRPFKKPELISRIIRDGVLEKDRKSITVILKQVSFMKDNTYNLLRHMWNDVSEDWPFYSEQERQSFRRRKPQNLTPPCSDGSTSSSGHSPSSTHPASPPSSSSTPTSSSASPAKRSSYYGMTTDDSNIASKKKRVSNYIRPPDMRVASSYSDLVTGSQSPGRAMGLKIGKSPLRSPSRSPRGNFASVFKQEQDQAVIAESKPFSWSPSSTSTSNALPLHLASRTSGRTDLQQQNGSKASDIDDSTTWTHLKDFINLYTPILNNEQRVMYKQEFSDNYTKYRQLHSILERVSKRFVQLETQLKHEEQGSEAWKNLKFKIVKEYQENMQDNTFVEAKKEFQYLHEKLAHIKKLVNDYDFKNAST